jgi:hypothetical protein
MVPMVVSIKDVADIEVVRFGALQDLVFIPTRVDYDSLPAFLAADKVTENVHVSHSQLSDNHELLPDSDKRKNSISWLAIIVKIYPGCRFDNVLCLFFLFDANE